MIVAINFADNKFEETRKFNSATALNKGKADRIMEYSPKDIDSNFVEANQNIFKYERGCGLWIWKPYFILKTLKEIPENNYLFYCDAGAYYINSISHLVEALEKEEQDIMPYELPLLERQFTKRETFEAMNYHNCNNNQILATCILFRNSSFARQFAEEWLHCMQNEALVSPQYFDSSIKEFEDFIQHREDQSIFSILCHKHGLKTFRDPSDYGFRPFRYAYYDRDINISSFQNSPYPQIVTSFRSNNMRLYRAKDRLVGMLQNAGIYNAKTYYLLHGKKRRPRNYNSN